MSTISQDLRFAFRTLGRSPVFTAVAVLSLALGIGVNTALFSFIDRLLLRSLPVRDPQSLVLLDSPGPMAGRVEGDQTFSYPVYKEIRDRNDLFSGVLARYGAAVTLGWKNNTELVSGELVSGNYFDVLGVAPYLGRVFTASDDVTAGAHSVVVLGHGFWTRKFGGDPSVVGQKILINSHPYEVVGVSAARFDGVMVGRTADVYVPLSMKAQLTPTYDGLDQRNYWFLNLFARLKDGIAPEQAQARLAPEYRTILQRDLSILNVPSERFNKRYVDKALLLKPGFQGRSDLRDRMSKPSLVLMSMVGLVLLIACANIANLLLARAAARQKEIAIRLSLGASRWDLVRQLFVESAVIALAGGAFGVLVSVWAGDLLLTFVPGFSNPTTSAPDWTTPDFRVLAFNFAVAIVTAVLFGLVPAWKATRPAVATTLKDQAGSVSSTLGDVRLRKGLVIAQIALSLLLLAGATLFARSLQNLRGIDPGFRPENVLSFSMDPSLSGYEGQKATDTLERVAAALRGIAGVRSIALTDNPLLANNIAMATVNIEGYQRKEDESMNPDFAHVSPGYFQAIGVRLIAGREFAESDRVDTQKVAIVNEAFAKRFFPKENPIGRRIGIGRDKPETTIVGVVGSYRQRDMRDADRIMYYMPYLQHDDRPGSYTFYVRAAGDATTAGNAVRREVRRVASTVPLFDMKTMESQVDEILAIDRAVSTMSAFFGFLATLLAAIGLYGVMAYTVTRRTREIGIRVALGAERSSVLWLVLREVALMSAIGIGMGLPIALLLSRYVESQLYGVKAADPLTYAAAVAMMLIIATFAGFLPANRASRVEPVQALRYE
jgi:predicted permease